MVIEQRETEMSVPKTFKFPMTKFGLKGDPRGAHVTLTLHGKTLLGTVQDFYRHEVLGSTLLKVNFFNGEPWPLEPACLAVDVLNREWA